MVPAIILALLIMIVWDKQGDLHPHTPLQYLGQRHCLEMLPTPTCFTADTQTNVTVVLKWEVRWPMTQNVGKPWHSRRWIGLPLPPIYTHVKKNSESSHWHKTRQGDGVNESRVETEPSSIFHILSVPREGWGDGHVATTGSSCPHFWPACCHGSLAFALHWRLGQKYILYRYCYLQPSPRLRATYTYFFISYLQQNNMRMLMIIRIRLEQLRHVTFEKHGGTSTSDVRQSW